MTDSRNKPELETLDYKPKECPECETPGYCGQILNCPKCGKTFPLYMKREFSGHVNGCPTETSKMGFNSAVIKPELRLNKVEDVKQPRCGWPYFEKPLNASVIENVDNPNPYFEQPNQNLMIIEEIEGLISQVNEKLYKLHKETQFYYRQEGLSCKCNSLVVKALEKIDIFQKTTLFELRKAFE